MASRCVRVDHGPEFERPVNLPPIVVLTPHLIACDWGMMRDLFEGDLIPAQPCLIGFPQDGVERFLHLNCELPLTHCESYYKLEAFQGLLWGVLGDQ